MGNPSGMITTEQAFSILENAVSALNEIEVSLWDARNCVLAETIVSPISMPPFRQSNMDGYAVSLHDSLEYHHVGEVKAGDEELISLKPGEAVKIFTGAAVPDSAQAVIQIEKVSIFEKQLLLDGPLLPNTNVRPMGSQISKNDIALIKGTFLNPAGIGFLAGLGITSVNVIRKPSIGIVITGNELVSPGQPLPHGKVYESNAIMLHSALEKLDFDSVLLYEVRDDFESTKSILQKAIDENDVVLVSGGISVGDYDFTAKALEDFGVKTLFCKVNQKPGKPLFAGKHGNKIIFALPGNPAAALTCFYVYGLPTLQKLSGMEVNYGTTVQKVLSHDFRVSNVRAQFLKAVVMDDSVTILPHQDSSMLDSFALANALVYMPDGNYQKTKGDYVALYLI